MKTASIFLTKPSLLLLFSLALASGCDEGDGDSSDADGSTSDTDTGNTASATQGDGDATGDGDGDSSSGDGDGDGDSSSGDGDGDTGTDTTGTDTGGGAHAGSCDFQPDSPECWHAVNEFDTPQSIMEACAMSGGSYSAGDCPTDNLIAICDQTPFKIFHYYEPADIGLAELACMQIGGVWMPQ